MIDLLRLPPLGVVFAPRPPPALFRLPEAQIASTLFWRLRERLLFSSFYALLIKESPIAPPSFHSAVCRLALSWWTSRVLDLL